MENVNKQRRNFISLPELEYGPLKFSFGMVCVQLTSKWVGIITIKTEKTQIHILSNVLVAVVSLDLKVPNVACIVIFFYVLQVALKSDNYC